MTLRAKLLVIVGLLGMYAGLHRGQLELASISLSVVIWVFFEWLRFRFRVARIWPAIQIQRSINGRSEAQVTTWANRSVDIRLSINLPEHGKQVNLLTRIRQGLSPSILFRDTLPSILDASGASKSDAPTSDPSSQQAGSPQMDSKARNSGLRRILSTEIGSKFVKAPAPFEHRVTQYCSQVQYEYKAKCLGAGNCDYPGVRVTFVDRSGFFQSDKFFNTPQTLRILPDYYQSGEVRPVVKRFNTLPSHGIHRLRNAGTGAELLELRDYVAGDPPKSIAWKASARRQKLMTRQYESEVPVRIQFFIDAAYSTRLGGYGKRLIDQINYVAASIAHAASQVGDPYSATLITGEKANRLSWFGGDMGFLQFLRALSDFSQQAPDLELPLNSQVIDAAMAIFQERYPEYLNKNYWRIPFSLSGTMRHRMRLAAMFGERFDLSPREQVECAVTGTKLASYIRRLFVESGQPWMAPLIPRSFISSAATQDDRSAPSLKTLSQSLTRATLRAKDNEVFVIFADSQLCVPLMHELLPAIKLAKSKHHRVAIICPATTLQRPVQYPIRPQSNSVNDLLEAAECARMRGLQERLEAECTRLGVPVSFTGEPTAIRMVLSEIGLARDGRANSRGGVMI